MNTQRIIMQVPLPKTLKISSEAVARDMGFSSLQEAIRVFLRKLSARELTFTLREPVERLSPKAEKRYLKMLKEIKEGKVRTKSFTDVDDMMSYLNA
jgi:antitoxin component of RelBE/YafQ-DinJ toxin-antitoxin module